MGNLRLCDLRFEPAEHITIYVVPRKHFSRNSDAFVSELLENFDDFPIVVIHGQTTL